MSDDDVLDAWYQLEFSVRRSMRYHTRRRAFYEFWHRATAATAVIFGSATLTTIFAKLPAGYTVASALVVTALGSIDLVVGFASNAWTHADLARRFIDLEKDMVAAERSELELRRLTAARLNIERDEPPVLAVLNAICHNDLVRAMGLPDSETATIGWWQRQFAQVFDLNLHKVAKRPTADSLVHESTVIGVGK